MHIQYVQFLRKGSKNIEWNVLCINVLLKKGGGCGQTSMQCSVPFTVRLSWGNVYFPKTFGFVPHRDIHNIFFLWNMMIHKGALIGAAWQPENLLQTTEFPLFQNTLILILARGWWCKNQRACICLLEYWYNGVSICIWCLICCFRIRAATYNDFHQLVWKENAHYNIPQHMLVSSNVLSILLRSPKPKNIPLTIILKAREAENSHV